MKKLAFGFVALALLAAANPVLAQTRGAAAPPTPEEMVQKRDKAELDEQYKNTLKRTTSNTNAPTRVDPWANLRGADTSKR